MNCAYSSIFERLGAAQHDDALPQERVGEEADAVQLDEHRRVPDPADAVRHAHGLRTKSPRTMSRACFENGTGAS